MTSILLATDLDGTLLDEDYGFADAMDAIAMVKQLGWKVAFVTSKTIAECRYWRQQFGFGDYFIPENGAAVVEVNAENRETLIKVFGLSRHRILEALMEMRRGGQMYEGFSDHTVESLVALSGLSVEQSRLAMTREYSEPLTIPGSDTAVASFLAELATRGLSAQRGGRFTTVSGHHDKGRALRYLSQHLPDHHSFALGDSWNDVPMLMEALSSALVLNPKVDLAGRLDGIEMTRSTLPGSAGWAELVTKFIEEKEL